MQHRRNGKTEGSSHAKFSDESRAIRSEYVSPTDSRLCFPVSMDCPYIAIITGSNILLIPINMTSGELISMQYSVKICTISPL